MTVSDMSLLAFGTPGPMEMLIVGMVVLLLFGNRLPSVMRSLGVGITEFKKGIKGEGVTEPNATIEDQRRSDAPRVD
jgi:sec-independent protein translocase protein TatA